MNKLLNASRGHWFWLALLGICVALEAGALFYQHVLEFLPCELCIYVRVWLMGIGFVCLFAVFITKFAAFRALASLAGLGLSVGLASETWNLFKVEYGIGDGGSCGFFANFPTWAPLDKWFPAVFEVQELCQATPVIVFGITMTHSLILVGLLFLLCFGAAFFVALKDLLPAK